MRILLLVLALPALADQVVLKDGKVLKGRLLNEGENVFYLKTDDALKRIPADQAASSKRDAPLPALPPLATDQGPLEDLVARVGPGGVPAAEYRVLAPNKGAEGALRFCLDTELLFQEALKEGLHKDDYVRDRVLSLFKSSRVTARLDPQAFTEEELRAFHKAHPGLFEKPAELDLRFAEVERGATAKGLKESDWKTLGWQKPEDLRHVLSEEDVAAVFKLKKGQATQALKCATGVFYILKAADRKDAVLLPFEEVRGKVRFELLNERQQAGVKALGDDKAQLYAAAVKDGTLRDPQLRVYLGNALVQKRKKPKDEVLKDLWARVPVRVMLEE